jgi:3-deoxy-D-manno-octulosonic-acid transferase
MGMLNKIYRKATIAYIGGGFGAGIHNIIEPLSYYKPVIHGPNCARFLEATLFGKIDATKIVNNAAELADAFTFFANNKAIEKTIAEKIAENLGAAEKVVREIQANLLL